jgi:hypothetical protein
MTIQENLIKNGYKKVPYRGKLYDLSCFEDCEQKTATFRLDPDGAIVWCVNKRGEHWPGIYFRFKNGEVLDLIRETRRLDQEVKKLRRELEKKENDLIELGYAKRLDTGPRDLITLVSRDKEWLSRIDSIGAIYTDGGPKGTAFLINGEI